MATTNGDVPPNSQSFLVSAVRTFLQSKGIRDLLVDVWASNQQLGAKIEQDVKIVFDAELRCTSIHYVEAVKATIVSMQQGYQTFDVTVEDDGTVNGACRTDQGTTASAASTIREAHSPDPVA